MTDQETTNVAGVQAPGPEAVSNASSRKRRGLALPPKGQALSRLQDLEQDSTLSAIENDDARRLQDVENTAASDALLQNGINAVNTASSNAVNTEGSASVGQNALVAGAGASATQPRTAPVPAARAVREPTTRITVDMPDSLHRRISFLSVETRKSIKDLVIEALDTTYFQHAPEDGR